MYFFHKVNLRIVNECIRVYSKVITIRLKGLFHYDFLFRFIKTIIHSVNFNVVNSRLDWPGICSPTKR